MAQKNLCDCTVTVCSNDTARDYFGVKNDIRFSDDVEYPSEVEEPSGLMELDFSHDRSW